MLQIFPYSQDFRGFNIAAFVAIRSSVLSSALGVQGDTGNENTQSQTKFWSEHDLKG